MPTQKPRINVTMPPGLYEVIARLAELQGVSKSSVIVDLLEPSEVPLRRTLALLEAASEAPRQVREGLANQVESLLLQLEAAAGVTESNLSDVLESMVGESGRRRRPSARKAPTPVSVTRGSGRKKSTK